MSKHTLTFIHVNENNRNVFIAAINKDKLQTVYEFDNYVTRVINIDTSAIHGLAGWAKLTLGFLAGNIINIV